MLCDINESNKNMLLFGHKYVNASELSSMYLHEDWWLFQYTSINIFASNGAFEKKSIVCICITLQICHISAIASPISAIASRITDNSIIGSANCLGPHQWRQKSPESLTKSFNIAPLFQVRNRGIPFPCNWGYCYLSPIGKVNILPCTRITHDLQVNIASDLILRSGLWCVWQFMCVYVDQLLLCEYMSRALVLFFCGECVLVTIKIQYMHFIIPSKQAAQIVSSLGEDLFIRHLQHRGCCCPCKETVY